MLEERIIINRTHDTVLRLLPPYIITERHVNEVVNGLDRVLTELAQAPKLKRKSGGTH
jgi:acetylornithine aminotransferase/acetylornithine/N-succinyldiaminopimelate aminotransferase